MKGKTGKYYDYSPNWYPNVGKLIVQTMFIQCFIHYFLLGVPYFKSKLMVWLDNPDPYKTKKTSMSAFMKSR